MKVCGLGMINSLMWLKFRLYMWEGSGKGWGERGVLGLDFEGFDVVVGNYDWFLVNE